MESSIILLKMASVIVKGGNKDIIARYLSLANKQLHRDKQNVWTIIGASAEIRRLYESKYGYFVPRSAPIVL